MTNSGASGGLPGLLGVEHVGLGPDFTTEIAEISGGAEALRQAESGDDGSGRPDIYVYPNAS